MVDTARAKYPPDMIRVADFPDMGSLENMANDVVDRVKHYAREQPITFGLWALGIGFVLGWKLKPW
jgi:tetrahydromethanopterin S-methyltransferase subunit F